MPSTQPIIELRGIRRSYPGDVEALRGVDLSIDRGEFVAIVGPSGAGKSTLLNILGLLEQPSAGEYLISGKPVQEITGRRLDLLRGRYFGFIFQAAHAIDFESVEKNVALPLLNQGLPADTASERASRAIDRVGLANRTGARARDLSGGERQRLAVARAAVTKPQVILADEPTGSLDSANGAKVMQLIRESHDAGNTIILITHDETIAALADRVVHIRDGIVVGDSGAHAQPSLPAFEDHVSSRGRGLRSLLHFFFEALNGLTLRPMRTVSLAAAFVLGIAGVVAAQGVTSTASEQIADQITQAGLSQFSVYVDGSASDTELDQWRKAIQSVAHVQLVGTVRTIDAGRAAVGVSPTNPDPVASSFSGKVVEVDTQWLSIQRIVTRPSGAARALGQFPLGNVALLGRRASQELGVTAGPGHRLWVAGRAYDVVGIISRSDANLDNAIVLPSQVATTTQIELRVRTDKGFPFEVAEAIPYALNPVNPGAVQVSTLTDFRNLQIGVTSDLGSLIGAVSLVVLVMAVLSSAVTLFLSVLGRTREIAIRRAIGTTKSGIVAMFLTEGILVGLIGGLAGSALGLVVALLVSYGEGWTPVLPPTSIPLGVVAGLITGALSAVVPAFRASGVSPAEAIRG